MAPEAAPNQAVLTCGSPGAGAVADKTELGQEAADPGTHILVVADTLQFWV